MRRWPRRLAIGAAAGIALFAIAGFWVVPPIARRVAEKQLGELLGRKVTIARVRVNPFALSVTVEGFRVFEADGGSPFVDFRKLYVNAQLSSVFRRAPVLAEIALDGLRVSVARLKGTADGLSDAADYNFSDILARLAARPTAPPPPPGPEPATPRFSLNNIRISDAAVLFEDRPLRSRHQITHLNLGVPFVSTLPVYVDSFVEPGLSVEIDGTPFALAGHTKPFTESLETMVDLRLDALDLTKYVAFVPMRLPFWLQSGRLTVALELSFVRPRADAPSLKVKGRVALEGLDVREKRGAERIPLAALDTLDVRIGESDLTAQRFHVDSVRVSGAELRVRRLRDGTLNLDHLAPTPSPHSAAAAPRARAATAPAPAPPSAQFDIGTFTVEKAVLHFADETVTPVFRSDVRDIGISVRGLSNRPGVSAQVQARLRAVPGGTLTQQGTLQLTPLAADVTVALDGVEPARFASYLQDRIAFDVVGGTARLGARVRFQQDKAGPRIGVSDGFFELAGLALRRRTASDDFFRMSDLRVHGAALDLARHSVTVEQIGTHDARLRMARDARGVVDLSNLVPPPAAVPPPGVSRSAAATPPPTAESAPTPWTVSVGRVELERWSARFEDHAVTPAAVVTVKPITLHVSKLSTAPGSRFGVDLHLGINRTGRVDVTGTAGLDPQVANLRFNVGDLEILPFQPYFAERVGLTVTSGTVSLNGQVGVTMPKPKGGAKPAPEVDLTGKLAVADLTVLDNRRQDPLVSWSAFRVEGLRLTNHPLAVGIDQVALDDLDARVVKDAQGQLNVAQALAPPGAQPPVAAQQVSATPQPAAGAAPTGSPVAVSIGDVVLKRAKVVFADESVQPHYTAEVADLSARVAGLSSVAGSTAAVDLSATVNRSGKLKIAGKTNPLAHDLFLDVQLALDDVELPPASPYSGKFVGYAIGKGKLGLSLDYKVANRKLQAKNNLVLDQFTFGDKVASPVATRAPVRLAVALLKDRRGVIDVDLPISGSLDDPQFKVWPAVLKVLGNLVVKAATAPFSLIAAAFGGGDQLSRIDFVAGAATLDEDAQRKARSLGKALEERPGLSLEIEGGADPNRDREGLRRFLVEHKLKALRVAELVRQGAPVSSPDQVRIDATDRPRLVAAAYEAEKFAKPKNALGLEKSLAPAEMEQLLFQNTQATDEDLRALALRRATVFEAGLAKNAPSATGRLFLVAPRVETGGGHVGLKLKKD